MTDTHQDPADGPQDLTEGHQDSTEGEPGMTQEEAQAYMDDVREGQVRELRLKIVLGLVQAHLQGSFKLTQDDVKHLYEIADDILVMNGSRGVPEL